MKLTPIIIIALLLLPIVYSLGVSPGRTTLQFEPNLKKEVRLIVFNNEQKDLNLGIYARGSLADNIDIPIGELQLSKDEQQKELSYIIGLPDKLKEPGLHEAEIVIREIQRSKGEEDIVIGTMQAVVSQLHVMVPYPGKYLVARLDIAPGKLDKETRFYIPMINFGNKDIGSVKAEISLVDLDGNVLSRADTEETSVAAGGRAELSAMIDTTNLPPGVTRAIAKITYDGKVLEVENTLFVKDFLLIPLDISVRDFKLGDIAKFNILVENIGNIKVEGASSMLLIDEKDGSPLANIKSISTDFSPLEKKEMVSYWDTKDVEGDAYQGRLVLSYGSKSDEKKIITNIGEGKIDVEIIGITGHAISRQSPEFSSKGMIISVIIVINVV